MIFAVPFRELRFRSWFLIRGWTSIFTNFLNVGEGRGAFDTWIGESVMQRALLALFEFMRSLALKQRESSIVGEMES